MVAIDRDVIKLVETCLLYDVPIEEIIERLAAVGVVGYDAFLAYKAGKVNLRMHEREYTEAK